MDVRYDGCIAVAALCDTGDCWTVARFGTVLVLPKSQDRSSDVVDGFAAAVDEGIVNAAILEARGAGPFNSASVLPKLPAQNRIRSVLGKISRSLPGIVSSTVLS